MYNTYQGSAIYCSLPCIHILISLLLEISDICAIVPNIYIYITVCLVYEYLSYIYLSEIRYKQFKIKHIHTMMATPQTQLMNNEMFIEDIPNAFYLSLQTDTPILIHFKEEINESIPLNNLSKFQDKLIIINLVINSTQFNNFKRLFPNYFNLYDIENYNLLLLNNNYDVISKWNVSLINSTNSIQLYLEVYLNINNETNNTCKQIELRHEYKQNEVKRIKSLIHQDKINRHTSGSNVNLQNIITKDNILSTPHITNECTLRIKLNDSSVIVHTFNSCTDSLTTVKKYIEIVTGNKIPSDVSFHKVLPKRRYSNQEELQSLNSLDLLPRSSLYLIKNKEYIRELRRHRDSSQDLKYIFFFIEIFRKLFQFLHLNSLISSTKNKNHSNIVINCKSYLGDDIRRNPSFPFNDHLP